MTEIESIKDRIRKLLARANSGQEGSELAMSMAMGLMAKHSIDQKEVGGVAVKAKQGKTQTLKTSRGTNSLPQEKIDVLTAAGVLYGCRVVLYSKTGFAFVGRDDNIEAAEVTAQWLSDQIDYLFKVYYKDRGSKAADKNHGKIRSAFKQAASRQVAWRAQELINNPPEHLLKDIKGGALVVKDHFALLNQENQEILDRMNTKTLKNPKMKFTDGTYEGLQAGNSVKLRQEITA